jgi:hypothetical protein
VVALGVVLVLALAWLLLRPAPAGPTAGPVATVAPSTDSVAIDGVFVTPVLTAEPRAGIVHFSWTYDAPSAKDTFRVRLGATQVDAAAATPTTVPSAAVDGPAAVDAPAAPGTQVCAIVAVVRAGQISPSSIVACATAS